MRAFFFLLMLVPLILSASIVCASVEAVTASHTYAMGENDSKNDARRMCFLEAKRKVIEKAVTFIYSRTQVVNGKLSKDEVNTYTAALVKVETASEKWGMSPSGGMSISMTVKALIDVSKLEKQLKAIKSDSTAQTKIKEQQKRLSSLEAQVASFQKSLGAADATDASQLRKERNLIFKEMDELQAKKVSIVSKIKASGIKVQELVELGMTKDEVVSLVGKPRTTTSPGYGRGWRDAGGWNYGSIWINFSDGIVECFYRSPGHITYCYMVKYHQRVK